MKTWQKVGIGLGGVPSLRDRVVQHQQANKGVVTVQTAKWRRWTHWFRR